MEHSATHSDTEAGDGDLDSLTTPLLDDVDGDDNDNDDGTTSSGRKHPASKGQGQNAGGAVEMPTAPPPEPPPEPEEQAATITTETLKGILQTPSPMTAQVDGEKGNADNSTGEAKDAAADTSKAVTFAEDIEVYDCKAATPITVSLDTPVHLIDPIIEAAKASPSHQTDQEDGATAPDAAEKDGGGGGYASVELQPPYPSPGDSHHDHNDEESASPYTAGRYVAARPSLLNLSKEQPAAILESTDTNKDKTAASDQPHSEAVAPSNGEQPPPTNVAVEEVEGETKTFSVTVVDESQLQDDTEETRHPEGSDALTADAVLEKALSASSPSVDHNVQDTIGPLENPAFLKTLNYSLSQPFDEDDQSSVQSNLDLTSLMTTGHTDPDLDGGWAWVVLCAAFLSLSILGASNLMAGVLMKAFLEEIDPDLTKASWIGSVYVALMCLCGPMVGMVMNRIGARLTMCLAGFVIFIGFLGASFSTSILQLIMTHGVVAGVGSGFAINPVFVIVGQYFNRLRGLAFGLLATGAGVGFLAGGAVISQLLTTFGLSGAYLLWSAVVLHIIAMGLLMLPSPEERIRKAERSLSISHHKQAISQQEITSGLNSMISGLNSVYSGADQNSVLSGLDRVGRSRLTSLRRHSSRRSAGETEIPLLKAVLHKEMSRSSHSVSTNRSHHRSQTQVFSPSQPRLVVSPEGGDLHLQQNGGNSSSNPPAGSPSPTTPLAISGTLLSTSSNGAALTSKPVQSCHHMVSSSHHSLANNFLSTSTIGPPQSVIVAPSSPVSARAATASSGRFQRPRLLSSGSHSYYRSHSLISQQGMSFREGQSDLDNQSLASALVSTLRPQDALTPRYRLGSRSISTLMGSVASFPTALSVITDDISRFDVFSTLDQKSLKDSVVGALDSMRLLRNKAFLVFLGTCLLWSLGEAPVLLYLPSYAISRGTSPMQASSLYTTMGIGSITGRFLTGLIASDRSIGPVLLHIGCLGLTGILVCVSPLITATVSQQMLFSGLLGLYTGSLVPLMTLMSIDLLGIAELPLGFGFICMAQGIGYLIGPPLSSIFVNEVGFVKAFVVSGVLLLCASLLGLFLPLFIPRDDFDDDQNSLDDLEKALRQASNSNSDEDDDDEEGDGGVDADDDVAEEDEEEANHKQLKPGDGRDFGAETNSVAANKADGSQPVEDGGPRIFDQELEPIPEVA